MIPLNDIKFSSPIMATYKQPYSINLVGKLIKLCQTDTRLAQYNMSRAVLAQDYFFGNAPVEIEKAIAVLHERSKKDPSFLKLFTKVIVDILNDNNAKMKSYYTAIASLGFQQSAKRFIPQASDAWNDVGTTLLELVHAIKENSPGILSNPELTQSIIGKLESYDPDRISFNKFILNYFFGGINTLFYNNLARVQMGLIKSKNGKYMLPESHIADFTSRNDSGGLSEDSAESMFSSIPAVDKELGYSLDEIKKFFSYWNTVSSEEKIDLILLAIKESDDPDLNQINITKDIIKASYNKITEDLKKAEVLLKNLATSTDDNMISNYRNQLVNLLKRDFIFKEVISKMPDQPETENVPEDSRSLEEMYGYNREMMSDIYSKKYPVSQSTLASMDPFDFRGVINSDNLNAALQSPEQALKTKSLRHSLVHYLIILAMLHADSRYGYNIGKGGRKTKSESFDALVEHFIDKEIDIIYPNNLSDQQKSLIKKEVSKVYYDTSEDQIRRYRSFMNIVHRDLASTHSVYSMGYKWGELTDEQIDTIAKKVINEVYPMISDYDNIRRQFKVLKAPTITSIFQNADHNGILAMVKSEISKKNELVKQMVHHHQNSSNAHALDIDKLVSDFSVKFNDILSKEEAQQQPEEQPEQANPRVFLGGLLNSNDIKYSDKSLDTIDKLYASWIIKNRHHTS